MTTTPRRRLIAAVVLLASAAAACTPGSGTLNGERTATPQPSATAAPATEAVVIDGPVATCLPLVDITEGVVEGLPPTDAFFPWDRADPVVLDGFDFAAVISGGPPPDGIRPVDDPCFDTVAAAGEWLQPQSPVLVVEVGDDRRAYPLAIMTQHEIVNDVVGGEPLVVTYCPLCNSGLAFERTVGGDVLDFGTSGRLFQSNLVMYDRQTRTLWTQFDGVAVVGADLVGTELARVPTNLLSWAAFSEATPDGLVLSRDSVPGRDYGRNPYPGYDTGGEGFLFDGPRDGRLPPDTRVVGLGSDADPWAVPLPDLQDLGVVELDVAGESLTVWWAPGQASALDAPTVDDGADVGSTAAFRSVLADGTRLSFTPGTEPGTFTDDSTGSSWNLLGQAVDGDLAGTRLQSVPLDDTFWFVWFAFQPDTAIAGP